MKARHYLGTITAAVIGLSSATAQPIDGWLQWRGPLQNGTSLETQLPEEYSPDGESLLWTYELAGRGTPVVARYGDQDRVIIWGYRGQGPDLQEVLLCADARTGKMIWEHTFTDFISDIIYNRYSIGSAAVDAETGNIYLMTSPGLFVCFDRDGNLLWQHSMMEQFGRLTFPNGRTGAPAIDGDQVILNCITSNWGRQGPARNRFYAFDKRSGEPVWASTPGVGPPFLKDSSFCQPYFDSRGGLRVFYAGTGCGNVVCVNRMTGEPLFRYQMSHGGINSQPIVVGDRLIAIHGKENIDDSGRGRMVALDLNKAFAAVAQARKDTSAKWPIVLDQSYELWRNDELSMFTSSPVSIGERIYQVTTAGELFCLDADTGRTIWDHKLGADQLHASPVVADGKLYVPTWHDGFYVIRPTDEGPKILSQNKLQGDCIGSPSVWNGKLYVHTTKQVHCFGDSGSGPASHNGREKTTVPVQGTNLPAAEGQWPWRLQIVPNEFLLRPGAGRSFRVRHMTADGGNVNEHDGGGFVWSKWIPPTAKVRAELDADFDYDRNEVVAASSAKYSAGAYEAQAYGTTGTTRGRILPSPPYEEDFESFKLAQTSKSHGEKFAYPPLPWIGARLKWEVRQRDGNNVLAKTLDRVLFQRSMVFIGHWDDANYSIAADVMTDGNRRVKGDVGLINQRYIIVLRGNNQRIEVLSNHDRLKVSVPFKWKPRSWYRLKTRVDVAADGSGIIRAKAWAKGEDEPGAWTIEVPHFRAHTQGSPGFFGFSPQSLFPVYIDNIEVRPRTTGP